MPQGRKHYVLDMVLQQYGLIDINLELLLDNNDLAPMVSSLREKVVKNIEVLVEARDVHEISIEFYYAQKKELEEFLEEFKKLLLMQFEDTAR